MSTIGEEVLKSFDLLPEPEKREVASEILRRTFAPTSERDETQLARLYSESADDDSQMAEQGIEDYERGLRVEDAE